MHADLKDLSLFFFQIGASGKEEVFAITFEYIDTSLNRFLVNPQE